MLTSPRRTSTGIGPSAALCPSRPPLLRHPHTPTLRHLFIFLFSLPVSSFRPLFHSALRIPRSALLLLASFQFLVSSFLSFADTHYVNIASTNATPPYTNWTTAATVIQDAVDAATDGDTVLVADGIYDTGSVRLHLGSEASVSRVSIPGGITVRSLSGAERTAIVGCSPMGTAAVRCAFVSAGASLVGFTLTNGATRAQRALEWLDLNGGGALCERSGVISNCFVVGNTAHIGGGIYGGRVFASHISRNTARSVSGFTFGSEPGIGGGVCNADTENCLVAANTADAGGGIVVGLLMERHTTRHCTVVANTALNAGGISCANANTATSCIIYYNTAAFTDPNIAGPCEYSCTAPAPTGLHNIASAPLLASLDNPHLLLGSPCIDAASGGATGSVTEDIDHETRANGGIADIGCDEWIAAGITGRLTVVLAADMTNLSVGAAVRLTAEISGRPLGYEWQFGDGDAARNQYTVDHAFRTPGIYAVVCTASNSGWRAAATTTVFVCTQETNYVAPSGGHLWPFHSWSRAATNIQAAIDAQWLPGGVVLVKAGTTQSGAYTAGGIGNRLVLTRGVTVRSVEGPEANVIRGGAASGQQSVRCAYVAKGCRLDGFTLQDGVTTLMGSGVTPGVAGGGVYCEDGGMVVNCILRANRALYGGGVFGGTVVNCLLVGNRAQYFSLDWNRAGGYGGGSYQSRWRSCTAVNNLADVSGGGSWGGEALNTVSISNTPNNYVGSVFQFSCTFPPPAGDGNITNLANGGVLTDRFYPAPDSPAIDSGIIEPWMLTANDLAGSPRILHGVVDMGAYETPVVASLRLLLQGPYDAAAHALRTAAPSIIPMRSPYAANSHAVTSTPTNSVDWISLELRSTNAQPVASASALLSAAGHVLTPQGSTQLVFEVRADADLHVAVRHRNHLAAVAATPLALTDATASYDFTTGPDKYLGGTNACVELEPGVWGMIAGDADGDGRITPTDRAIVTQQMGKTGYLSGDLNLDGKVDGKD
jgi:PKD repeat protein